MKRYVEGENRFQSTLFPESLEDYIAADNPVRVVDVFVVDELDLKELGFEVVLDPTTSKMIIGRLPIEKLAALAELKSVRYVAPQTK